MNSAIPAASTQESADTAAAHESGRRFGLRDGIFQATTQGAGEQYLSAFALMLHATPFQLSLLSALPQILGTWAQFVSVKVSHWFPHRKAHVLWGIIGQSIAWLPILMLPLLFPQRGPWLIVAGTAFYFGSTLYISCLDKPDHRSAQRQRTGGAILPGARNSWPSRVLQRFAWAEHSSHSSSNMAASGSASHCSL